MSGRWEGLVTASLVLVVAASRLILLYASSSPEPDSLAMVAGLTMAMRGDAPMSEAFLYGREGSPGIYLIARFLYPLFTRDPSHLLGFLNGLTVLASAAMVWPAYGIARHFLQPAAALAATAIAVFAPAVWELGTYFHPEIPAAALLLFAIHAALGANRTRAGLARALLAIALGAAAFLLRVHVLFVLPALVLAAYQSAHRRRNIILLMGTVSLGVVLWAALQSAVARPDQGASAGLAGYVSMIAGMYTSAFSLPGLVRSAVWAGFGLGIMSIAGLIARLPGRRKVTGRALWLALMWAIPSLLFWLPQPVPILRHYVLPTLGIALALGTAAFAGRSRRYVATVAGLVLAGNVAVPEIAYRAYNARHPGDPKTPHGAVFYTHDVMANRIARFNGMAGEVVAAMHEPGSPGAIVFTQWEGYGHAIYRLTQATPGLRPSATTLFFPTVQERRYEANNHEVHFINYVYLEDPELKARAIDLILESVDGGYPVLIPQELANGPLAGILPGSISIY